MSEYFKENVLWWIISFALFTGIWYLIVQTDWVAFEALNVENLFSFNDLGIFVQKVFLAIILFFIFGIILKLFQYIFLSRFVKKQFESDRYVGLIKLFGVIWWLFYAIVILSIFLENWGSIITSLGLIGFGLTLALQKPILNFVGWLTINFKSIYKVGDRVEIGNIRGDVKEIAIMNTVLDSIIPGGNAREFKILTFPNEIVLSTDVVNYTKESNYILDKLGISITYESDYHRAVKVLEEVVLKVIKQNRKSYQKYIKIREKEIQKFITESKKLLNSKLKKKEEKKIEMQIEENKAELEEQQKKMDVLEEEFIPRIRVEMLDSAILIEAFYLVPYNEVKKTRTKINVDFMDEIAKGEKIEIAYPHMEIVYQKDKMDYSKK